MTARMSPRRKWVKVAAVAMLTALGGMMPTVAFSGWTRTAQAFADVESLKAWRKDAEPALARVEMLAIKLEAHDNQLRELTPTITAMNENVIRLLNDKGLPVVRAKDVAVPR